jgi:hypothetical protein
VMSAHCMHKDPSNGRLLHGLCRMDRTVKPSPSHPNRGRPAAYLIAWVKRGCRHLTREEHFRDRLGSTISYEERLAERNWAVGQPDMEWMLSQERAPRADEGPEPLGNPH